MTKADRNEHKRFPIVIWILGLIFFFGFFGWINANLPSTKDQAEKPDKTEIDTQAIKTSPEPTLDPTSEPSFQAESSFSPELIPEMVDEVDPYDIMVAIGKEVTDNSNVSVFDNKDGSIDVINNVQLTPEVNIGWGFDTYTRKWVTEFLAKSYTSNLKIRYVLVTVSFLNTGRPATRAGLGVNQASKYTEAEWNSFAPYDLCTWLNQTQIGDNVDSGSPSFNPSNWAFAKNYACD